eukprot:TRINITY_DN46004_c0_g1_i1.p1 TRINITY_DN46004_c0_g1~~TRINITY_DN46004_c0_g1_i1.p1  ORF type:complete len:339 (-),score=62.17 TRINITY_DN46004_c0_g1_i1:111-1127(-)
MSVSRPGVDCLCGEWRRPHNDLMAQNVGGGHKAIHDDSTAQAAGFAGAPIHGTVHWSQFTPLLLTAFGPAWFETGSISVHFVSMVLHLQPVRAFMGKPEMNKTAQQVDIWMEHMDGRVVLEGTASVGLKPGEMTTMAQKKVSATKPVKGNLLFVRQPIGAKTLSKVPMSIGFGGMVHPALFPFTLKQKLECITEFHPWFTEEAGAQSPWGRTILPPECLNAIMLGGHAPDQWPDIPGDEWLHEAFAGRTPVALFGGCEVILHNGPVFAGEQYELTREVVGKGETPRAEFSWTRTYLTEKVSGKLVAEMTLQNMNVKSTLEGYEELRAKSDALAVASKL